MAFGYRDTRDFVKLTGVDLQELENIALKDGTTYDQIVGRMNLVMAGINAEINSDPLWASLAHFSDEPTVEYLVGNTDGFGRYTEYGVPDPQRGETEGHMLPLIPWDRGLGWTWYSLRNMRMGKIDADLTNAVKDARDIFRVQMLTRMFKREDDSGAYNGLGTTGFSPGFATAAASTAVDFTPPKHNGVTFTSDHEHYVGITGGAFTNAVFADSKEELMEHGHNGPYNFLIGKSDEDTVKGLSDFTPVAESLVAYGDNTNLARLGTTTDINMNGSYIIGTINDFSVRVLPSVPQYYGFGWKSYGMNSPMNPLRVRLEDGMDSFGFIVQTDPRAGSAAFPLQNLMLWSEFGVGVNDRTAATARYVNSATWVSPVVT